MDFLKACTTNVHALENIAATPYTQYSWKDDQPSGGETLAHIRTTITWLREQNVLCTSVGEHLWVFGHLEDHVKHHVDVAHEALVDAETGTLETDLSNSPASGKNTKHLFLDAVEHAIAYRLAEDSNVLHVGPWTWLYCQTEFQCEGSLESALITISIKCSDSGALYLVPRILPSSWQPLEYAVAENAHGLILAPMGYLARPVQEEAEVSTSNHAWKEQVAAALVPQNINLSAECHWQAVEFIDGPSESVFLWPTRLCLASRANQAYHSDPYAGKFNWRSWFAGIVDQHTFLNPLALAEAWYNGASERERLAQQPDCSPAQIDDLDNAIASSAPADGQDANIISSPFNQRQFDQQTAMAGIYPTPPDGLTQSVVNVQANLATTPSVTNAEQIAASQDLGPTSDDLSKEAEPAAADHDDYQMGPEDLFGDVGEIGFGENDVGDADFSFFDEPDDDAMAADDAGVALPVSDQGDKLEDCGAIGSEEKKTVVASSPDTLLHELPAVTDTHHASADAADNDFLTGTNEGQQVSLSSPPKVPYEKPLSPFGIREHLLPPPVPASMAQPGVKREFEQRRHSTFQPFNFKAGFDLGSKYASAGTQHGESVSDFAFPKAPSIGLPPIRKKSRALKIDPDVSRTEAEDDSESEEDSFESSSSESDAELPPRLPWDNRKRKRANNVNGTHSSGELDVMWPEALPEDVSTDVQTRDTLLSILETRYDGHGNLDIASTLRTPSIESSAQLRSNSLQDVRARAVDEDVLPTLEETYELRKDDLIYVAQVVSEHSTTALGGAEFWHSEHHGLQRYVEKTLGETLPDSELRDLGQVALIKEPPPRVMPNGKAPQGQPRPPQRSDSTMIGPDYFSLPPPYVKVQRGSDGFEMLPTSLPFWEPLGLRPTSGPKDVQAFCVFPGNADLQLAVRHFMTDVGTSYDSCKYGSHVHSRIVDPKDALDTYRDGLAPVKLDNDASLMSAFKAYAQTCGQLGKALASMSHHESERATVIYMLNPFAQRQALHHLAACFWVLFKAYRENLSKAQKGHSGGDIVLQIVPIELVASFDTVVVLSSKQAMTIAREVYDRCPPSSTLSAGGDSAVLPILSAPSVELASAAPKRIGFQLASEPPHHLLHEGSILHLAYACSKDGQWVTAAWSDNTGLYQSVVAYSLRGKSLAEVAEEVLERTYEILAARKVTWRLFIVTHHGLDQSMSQCWRSLSRPRAQPLCVTLSSVQPEAILVAASLASPTEGHLKDNGQDGGFLTPASTPQGNNYSSSPDVSGQTNAPPTPAPSETPASVVDVEMETHLVDTTDETWGALISPTFSSFISEVGLANALIFKRGRGEAAGATTDGSRHSLPGMGVTLHWTMQVKPNGAIDEGTVKQAELTLREVVKMYRNLALLTKAKGLDRGRAVCAPLPVAAAMLGAEGLDGLLPAIQ